jgi:hypothetical protein
MREPDASLPTEGHAQRLQGGDQPLGLARLGSDELGHTRGDNAARAMQIATDAFPHHELNMDRACTPGQIRQAALIAAMDCG